MSEIVPSSTDLSLEGETLANDYHWRSTKAKKQLRDRFGRWISLGANVKYRSNGGEQSGVVTSVVDGKAYIDQKNLDGTVTQQVLDPGALRVIASKATLPPSGSKIQDDENNFYKKMDSPEFRKALSETGQAYISRADGYGLSASTVEDNAQGTDNKVLDGTEIEPEESTKGNPILYQLFAPGGRSLGIYSAGAEADFDGMVETDKGAPAPAPVAEVNPISASLSTDIVVSGESSTTYRVPEAVKSNIAFALKQGTISHPVDRAHAQALAQQDQVGLEQVEWIGKYFEAMEPLEQLRGGYAGRKWASKILAPVTASIVEDLDDGMSHPKYQFDDDVYAYFAVGSDPGSTLVTKLLSVNYETGDVYSWTSEGFSVIPDMDITEVDEPQIIPIDEMTADEFAHWLDSGTSEEYDILDTDAEERNLFTLADSEIDYDELDRSYSIIAAAGDGVYTPVERAQNAKVQARGAGGKFGGGGANKAPAPEAEAVKVQKATLPVELPLVENPAARISEWLSTAAEAPVVAAGEVSTDAPAPDGNPAQDQALEDSATGPTNEAIYFAIVDDVDKTAVLDAIAIVKSNGTPSAFLRSNGSWTASPDTLASLQGSTPPPVVELADPATVKTVLAQIDDHDAQSAPAEPAAPTTAPVAASGYALPDGSYTIIDVEGLQEAVVASGGAPDIFVKAHIRKRARALNRMDVVPAEWREFSLAEIGELSASQTVYGEYGEIIVASGIPGVADTPSDLKNVMKLQNYWTRGKGALKIRWGTKGDLTRAHRHLSKYVGPQRAWGLAQKYHRSIFGVYNHTHDVATGQYVPKRRK